MATADGSVIIDVGVDKSGVSKGVKSIKTEFSGLEKSVKKIGGLITKVFGAAAILSFGKAAIDVGSDVQEVQNVVDTAFRDMAYRAEEFASTAITQFGMSSLAAKKTSSNYMAMARGMGVVDETASEMAISLAGLSGDVASFYNISQEEAATKLAGVFTGESEALKSIGVVMTETNLQAYALSQGINKQMKDMTQAEKVALRYGFVTNSLGLAQGDFAKTADSWANQTRILSMQWQEFMSSVGQTLITVLKPLVVVLNQIVGRLIATANAFNAAIQSIFGGATNEIKQTQEGAESVDEAISGATEEQDALTDAIKKTNKEQKKAVAGFDELEIITSNLQDNADSFAGSISGTDVSVGFATEGGAPDTTWIDTFSIKLEPAILALEKLTLQLEPLQQFSSQALQDFYNLVLVPIGDWVLSEGFPRFVGAISEQLALVDWSKLNGALANLWGAVSPFAINIGEGLLWFWENCLTPLVGWALDNLIPAQIDLITAAIQFIDEIIQAAEPALLWFWDTFLVPIRDFIWQAVINFINLLTDAFSALTDWAKENQSTVKDISVVVLGFLAGIWVYKSTKNLVNFCKTLGDGFVTLGNKIAEGGLKGAFFAAAIGILAAGIIELSKNWDKMTPAERAITILGGLAAAATAAAIAIALFHTSWSIGIAAAAIAGGLALLGLSFAFGDAGDTGDAAKRAADNFYSSYDWDKSFELPALAQGAVIPPNKEFVAVLGDQKSGTNIETPLSTMIEAFTTAMQSMGMGGGQTVVMQIDGREFGRFVNKYGVRESNRIGMSLVGVK